MERSKETLANAFLSALFRFIGGGLRCSQIEIERHRICGIFDGLIRGRADVRQQVRRYLDELAGEKHKNKGIIDCIHVNLY